MKVVPAFAVHVLKDLQVTAIQKDTEMNWDQFNGELENKLRIKINKIVNTK
jgi:hypothetical protein